MSGSLSVSDVVDIDCVHSDPAPLARLDPARREPLDGPVNDVSSLPRLTGGTIRLWRAFSSLPIEHRRWALTTGVIDTAQAGDGVRVAGEIAVVLSGCLSTTAAGSALSAQILSPGDVVATGAGEPVEGIWISAGELYRARPEAWSQRAGPEGLRFLLGAEERRRAALERRVVCLTHHLATARVADLLMAIHDAQPEGAIALSQERIGAMLGLRRTTVNASCRTLETQGGSRTLRSRIRIVDPAQLSRAACGCRNAGRPALAQTSVL